jgi:hypothetical protein
MAFNKVAYNKNQLIEAMKKSLGIVTNACQMCNVSRETFYTYMEKDAEFKKQIEDIENTQADFVESQFMKNIKNGDTSCIIFYLKTKGRKRGYTERQELDVKLTGVQIVAKDTKQADLIAGLKVAD